MERRDGEQHEVDAAEVVEGDLMLLRPATGSVLTRPWSPTSVCGSMPRG